jgi:hypothetical protein
MLGHAWYSDTLSLAPPLQHQLPPAHSVLPAPLPSCLRPWSQVTGPPRAPPSQEPWPCLGRRGGSSWVSGTRCQQEYLVTCAAGSRSQGLQSVCGQLSGEGIDEKFASNQLQRSDVCIERLGWLCVRLELCLQQVQATLPAGFLSLTLLLSTLACLPQTPPLCRSFLSAPSTTPPSSCWRWPPQGHVPPGRRPCTAMQHVSAVYHHNKEQSQEALQHEDMSGTLM